MNYKWKPRRRSAWKGLLAGVAGGIAGSIAMTQYQKAYKRAAQAIKERKEEGQQESSGEGESATMKTADRVSRPFIGRSLTRREKERGGPIVHYAFGTAIGAAYGTVAEYAPVVKKFAGVPFGAAVFVGADEIAVPALKLSKGPAEYPASTHLFGLSSHLVYGLATEGVRRLVRRALRR